MSDTWLAGMMSGILPTGGASNVPASVRQRLALAMMMQKRAYPKTLGEGLSSIGDSVGDALTMRGVERDAAASEVAGQAFDRRMTGEDPPAAGGPAAALPTPSAPPAIAAPPSGAGPGSRSSIASTLATTGAGVGPGGNPTFPTSPPLLPARPLPPDELPENAPPGVVRMPSQEATEDWRRGTPNPVGVPPPTQPIPGQSPQQLAASQPRPQPPVQPPVQSPVQPPQQPPQSFLQPPGQPSPVQQAAMLAPSPIGEAPGMLGGQQQIPQPPAPPPPADDRFAGAFPPRTPPQAPQVPPQAPPVVAGGGDPTPEQRSVGRDALAKAMMAQQAARSPVQAPPAPEAPTAPPQQSIRQAPPAQAAPAPARYGAGYIPEVGPEPTPPPTRTPTMERIAQEIRSAPASHREAIIARAAPYIEQEKARLAQAHEKYQSDLIEFRARRTAAETAKVGQQKSINDDLEAQQRIEKGKSPDRVTHDGNIFERDPRSGIWKDVTPGSTGQPVFKGTEFQGKALINHNRARLALDTLTPEAEKVLSTSPVQTLIGTTGGGVGRALQAGDYREAHTAADNFVQAFIRQQSGGAYTDAELEAEARGMLPKQGDTARQIEDKRGQREAFVNGLHAVLGSSNNQKVADQQVEIERTARAARKAARDAAAKGSEVRDFASEAEAEAAWLDPGTPVRINGRLGKVK